MKEGICRKTRSVDHNYGECNALLHYRSPLYLSVHIYVIHVVGR